MMRYRQCLCHNFPSTVATPSSLSSRLHLASLRHKKSAFTRWATLQPLPVPVRHTTKPERLAPTR